MALRADGTVRAWGDDFSGALGVGRQFYSPNPVSVNGLSGVNAVAAGFGHVLALKSNGSVWAWGDNLYGALGDGTNTGRSAPVQAIGLTGVSAISA